MKIVIGVLVKKRDIHWKRILIHCVAVSYMQDIP